MVFKDVTWQKSAGDKVGPKLKFKTISKLRLAIDKSISSKLSVVVKIQNTGEKPIGAVMVRCAFYMSVADLKNAKQPIWTVPFALEESRVSMIKSGDTVNVKMMTHIDLVNYLKRLKNTGFWPTAIKAEIMVEPHSGDNLADNITSSTIQVVYD